jgi:DNA processing protein
MNDYELWLANSPLNFKLKIDLINNYKSAENLWCDVINSRVTELLNKNLINKLRTSWDKEYIKQMKETINKKEIKVVTYMDEDYPKALRNIIDPPYMLFYYGDIKYLNRVMSVSIVGSRKCTHYGIDATNCITKELVKRKVAIISGMARGVDSIAHKNCLENGGYTCAVLGSGIDVVYPKENVVLFKEICKKGSVISEFLPGTKPMAYNFPIRNRIVSALSQLTIVVEAGDRSGSLITAGCALDQGRDVVAVPGSIFSHESKGCNKLLNGGAAPFISIDELLRILGIEDVDEIKKKKTKNSRNSKLESILCSMLCNSPIHIDDIIRITNIDIQLLYEVLFEMQLRDEIRCLSGNYYVKINETI